MKFIQLGNLKQCVNNGLNKVKYTYEFGKVIERTGEFDFAIHLSAFETGGHGRNDWHSTDRDRTSFYLEIKAR